MTDEYKKEHSQIPWNALYGLRNRIVHDYGSVILDVVYEVDINGIHYLKYDEVSEKYICQDEDCYWLNDEDELGIFEPGYYAEYGLLGDTNSN